MLKKIYKLNFTIIKQDKKFNKFFKFNYFFEFLKKWKILKFIGKSIVNLVLNNRSKLKKIY